MAAALASGTATPGPPYWRSLISSASNPVKVRQLWRWLEHIPVANAAYPASDNFDFISQLIKR